jgi:hypothetical protein
VAPEKHARNHEAQGTASPLFVVRMQGRCDVVPATFLIKHNLVSFQKFVNTSQLVRRYACTTRARLRYPLTVSGACRLPCLTHAHALFLLLLARCLRLARG